MKNNLIFYFLIFLIFPFLNCSVCNNFTTITVSQSILQQALYYQVDNTSINNTFVDFNYFKFYKLDMEKIKHTSNKNILFEWFFTDKKLLNIKCKDKEKERIKCNDIILEEHIEYTFYFDYLIAKVGGIISFILILFGIFFLFRGYIYYNLTMFFYCALCNFLFWREYMEFMVVIKKLNTDVEKSEIFCIICFGISIVSSIAYGYANFLFKYLRYFSLGIVEGLILGKFLFYYIIQYSSLGDKIELKLFITEISCAFVFMVTWFLFRDKYPNITMVRISLIASYGIIYGLNVLFGGYPFIPFLILAKKFQADEKSEEFNKDNDLFYKLVKDNNIYVYLGFYVFFSFIGCYFNITNTKVFLEKAKKKISIY